MSISDDIRAGRSADGEFDTGTEPTAVQRLGAAVAQALSDYPVTGVVCWSGNDEAVFAHVVAAELGARVLRAHESLGLLTLDAHLSADAEVALVATRWSKNRPLKPLEGLVTVEKLRPVVTLSILRGSLDGEPRLPSIVLEDL